MKKIYFSASIKGANADPLLASKVIAYMQKAGHSILSEHIAGKTMAELEDIFSVNTGTDKAELVEPNRSKIFRKIDMMWVDEATHVVALVTGPSLGVGMELERALLKPERGLPATPILCLVPEEHLPFLSSMVRGVTEEVFVIETYKQESEIFDKIDKFLKEFDNE